MYNNTCKYLICNKSFIDRGTHFLTEILKYFGIKKNCGTNKFLNL